MNRIDLCRLTVHVVVQLALVLVQLVLVLVQLVLVLVHPLPLVLHHPLLFPPLHLRYLLYRYHRRVSAVDLVPTQ